MTLKIKSGNRAVFNICCGPGDGETTESLIN